MTDPNLVLHWFVIQTNYNRELKLKKLLDEINVQSFIPMKYKEVVENEQKKKLEVPVVSNLIFICSTRAFLDEYQATRRSNEVPIRYMRDFNTKQPVIVNDQDMHFFIQTVKLSNKNLLYLRDNIEKFSSHPKVRVTCGQFEGVEGYAVRIRRDRKVVILLHGVIAVAISGIHYSLLEIIK